MPSNSSIETIVSNTDVLVVGGGPAGLISAWWLARCGIRVRVVDKDPQPLLHGRADGMRSRTVEILDSMGSGMQETVTRESFPMLLSSSWMRDDKGDIFRAEEMPMYEDHSQLLATPFCPQALSQGRLERIIQDGISDVSGNSVQVERGFEAVQFEYDESKEDDPEAYPVTIGLRRVLPEGSLGNQHNGSMNIVSKGSVDGPSHDLPGVINGAGATSQAPIEMVKAKYVIGCDGARSWLREQLDIKTDGSHTNTVWAALDIYPITDFPDVKRPNGIQTDKGTLMIIPREKGLSRVYVPFGHESDSLTRESVTLEQARELVRQAFKPYNFDFEHCQWWSAYSLGQRHAEASSHPGMRILLCGDAVHNNSPLIGLGLNVSAQDAWNLGWKLALAMKAPKGVDRKALLSTYQDERLPVAKTLVWYDRNWTTLFNKAVADPLVIMQRYFEFRAFSDAFVLNYPESSIAAKHISTQEAAPKLIVGESFPQTRLAMHADGQTYWSCSRLRSDGRFHLILFAGDLAQARQRSRVETFCERLSGSDGSDSSLLYSRYPYCFDSSYYSYDRSGADRGKPASMINFVTILGSHHDIPLLDLPEAMRGPKDKTFGWDYSRVLSDRDVPYDRYCDGKAHDIYGVNRETGCVAVVRPDMHIGWVGALEDFEQLETFFEGVLGKAWER